MLKNIRIKEASVDRRNFIGIMGALGALPQVVSAQAGKGKARCYALETWTLAGNQYTRLSEYLSKSYLPALAKIHSRPALVLNDIAAPNPPQVAMLTSYQSVEEMWNVRGKIAGDKALEAATDAWQAGSEKPFESFTTAHLEAEPFSPDPAPLNPQPATPRVFEMRVYHNNTARGQRGLEERFAEAEVRILTNCGATPVLFSSTVAGPDMPNVTWMMGFADGAAREKFLATFAADPDWAKLRAQSLERYGQIPATRKIAVFQAASYSPIR